MRLATVRDLAVATATAAGLWLGTPQAVQAQSSTGCAAVNGFTVNIVASTTFSSTTATGLFLAGQVVTVTVTGAAGWTIEIIPPDGSADVIFGTGGTATKTFTIAADITASITVDSVVTAATSGTLTISCSGSAGSTISGPMQNAINAQFAISNG